MKEIREFNIRIDYWRIKPSRKEQIESIMQELKPYEIKKKQTETLWQDSSIVYRHYKMDTSDPLYHKLVDIISQSSRGQSLGHLNSDVYFLEEEMEQTVAYIFDLDKLPSVTKCYEEFERPYEDKCKRCKRPGEEAAKWLLPHSAQIKRYNKSPKVFQSEWGGGSYIFVSLPMYEYLRRNGIEESYFIPVTPKKSDEIIAYELRGTHVLEEGIFKDPNEGGKEEKCKDCGAVYIKRDVPTYFYHNKTLEVNNISVFKDVNRTAEYYFGEIQRNVISTRLHDLILKADPKAAFYPVFPKSKSAKKIQLPALEIEQRKEQNMEPKQEKTKKTLDDLKLELKEAGLGKYFTKMKKYARNAIRLLSFEKEEDRIPLGASKIGGNPDLPKNMQWFCHEKTKQPLSFICQINFEDVKTYDVQNRLPERGILYLFYDCTEDGMPWGFDPEDIHGKKVFFYDGDMSELERKMPAKYLEENDLVFDCMALNFENQWEIPEIDTAYAESVNFSDDTEDAWWEYKEEMDDEMPSKLLGHSNNIQSGMEEECEFVTNGLYCGDGTAYESKEAERLKKNFKDWSLLLQLASNDTDMMWGDDGNIYLWIKEEDLKKRDFDKAWLILQCY